MADKYNMMCRIMAQTGYPLNSADGAGVVATKTAKLGSLEDSTYAYTASFSRLGIEHAVC